MPRAADVIRDGGLVAFGTETVYGLGADALDRRAVARIFSAKERPEFDPLIVHFPAASDARRYVADPPEAFDRLADRFWPGPLTLVVQKSPEIPDLVTSGLPTVGLRVPGSPQAREFLAAAGVPIAAPSANLFGRVSPTTAAHVAEQLGDRIDYILDGGPCTVGVESTILRVDVDPAVILRPGGVTLEDLQSAGFNVVPLSDVMQTHGHTAIAPGMLPQHYAPQTPLTIVASLDVLLPDPKAGVLALQPIDNAGDFGAEEVLSERGDLVEAAANFFAALRRLDAGGFSRIIAQEFPEEGLGRALNDRLCRAALNR